MGQILGSSGNAWTNASHPVAPSMSAPQNNFQGASPINTAEETGQLNLSQGYFNGINNNEGQLAQAMLAQSQGQGPNPAQAMLNQSTDQNIRQNTGMISSQKGINPALAQALASKNAASTSQTAAGQSATMNAQQQMGAQQNLSSLYNNQANQNLSNASTSGQLINQGSLGAQGLTAAVQAQNAAANQGLLGGVLGAAGTGALAYAMMSDGGTVKNYDSGGTASQDDYVPGINPWAKQVGSDLGGMSSSSDQIAKGIMKSAGINLFPSGVNINPIVPYKPKKNNQASGSSAIPDPIKLPASENVLGTQVADNSQYPMAQGVSYSGPMSPAAGFYPNDTTGSGQIYQGNNVMLASKGATIPSHMHPIAKIYHANFKPAGGTKMLKAAGGDVPGKAKVRGDSETNDTVKTLLSPGEVVIPRSIMQSDDPAANAAKFVANELRKKGSGSSKADFKDALKQAISQRKGA